jgi:hypothetical protein
LLDDDYRNGTWEYDEITTFSWDENEEGEARVSAAIFDIEHLLDPSSIDKE